MTLALAAPASAQTALRIADFLTMPMTGTVDGANNVGQLARVNVMREEPGGRHRFFIADLNGPLYIFDKTTKALTPYLDFNGRGSRPGLFHRFTYEAGFANGLINVQFDPDYPANGRFYTIHLEEPSVPAPAEPDGRAAPGLNLTGYTTTAPVKTPGAIEREAVVIEWTDLNTEDAVFEGTAREILRVQLNTRIHPMGDLIFNPTARKGTAEWGVMYIACGDGGSGEQGSAMRSNPQRLDTLVGKILRIIPDLKLHATTSAVSANGRYRIPNDNPFVAIAGAKKEVWALGLRNPHRLTWDADPANPLNNHLFAATIGLHSWESVYVIHKGANYGYSLREGRHLLKTDNMTTDLPAVDRIPVQVTDTATAGTVRPSYPVVEYGHVASGGDAIAGGFVYRGSKFPELRGKYIFGDISTGRVWYADVKEMVADDDGKPETVAAMHELSLAKGTDMAPTMFPIVKAAYHARGGKDVDLPGSATVSGRGRADIRLAADSDGEIYILSKSDGMIRVVTAVESATH